MDAQAIEAQLTADGYTQIESKALDPRPANEGHEHPYDIRGFVVSGTFIVAQDGQRVSYQPGQAFNVARGQSHTEEVGPEGPRIVVGRKY